MKMYGEVEIYFHKFLTLAVDGSEWSVSCPGNPGETATGTHWKGGWVGPRASLDTVAKKKQFPLLGIEPQSSTL
jgi:hypothetical protein